MLKPDLQSLKRLKEEMTNEKPEPDEQCDFLTVCQGGTARFCYSTFDSAAFASTVHWGAAGRWQLSVLSVIRPAAVGGVFVLRTSFWVRARAGVLGRLQTLNVPPDSD